MSVLAFALGFIIGVLARPAKLQVSFYYPSEPFSRTLDERRRWRWTWETAA